MNYRHKSILLLGFLAIFLNNHAQVGSPYSQFGFGNNQNKGFEQSKAMGGIGIGLRSNYQLNNLNPASYTGLDSLTVIYALGLNSGYNKIESSVDKMIRTDTKFGYFVMGFKGNKHWGSSFGVAPVTSVDYTYMYSDSNDVNGRMDYYLYGTGGLNEVYWGNSFLITPNLSLGINASYIFGEIEKVTTMVLAEDYVYGDNTKVQRKMHVSDLKFNYGIQYKFNLKEKSSLIIGAVFENKMQLNSKESILAGTVAGTSELNEDFYKDIYILSNNKSELLTTVVDTSNIKSSISLPNAFGIGFTYNYKDIWIVGADVIKQNWSEIQNDFYNASYNDLIGLKVGMEYTPDLNSVNHYLKRIHYRFGGHYTKSQLEVRNTQINDYGLSLGFGLPLRSTKTAFSLSFEAGQRGTLEQNLLRETYGIISLNISLSDIWFIKRKIN